MAVVAIVMHLFSEDARCPAEVGIAANPIFLSPFPLSGGYSVFIREDGDEREKRHFSHCQWDSHKWGFPCPLLHCA